MIDSPHEECGIVGIFAPNEDVARMAYFGLFALQHRGQEAAGIAVSDGENVHLHKDIGLVTQVFTPHNLAPLKGPQQPKCLGRLGGWVHDSFQVEAGPSRHPLHQLTACNNGGRQVNAQTFKPDAHFSPLYRWFPDYL